MRKAYEPKVARPKLRPELVRPLAEFLHSEANSGLVLVGCAALALVWANSPWAASYFALWSSDFVIGLGASQTTTSLLHLVNDGLMALFFLLVGLEIKRELLLGELSSVRKAALPALAALGGMVIPACIYLTVNAGRPESRGWGVPMATDIAFSLGVLALLGSRVPYSLKVLLAAVAIVDDLGAVLVIAIFYSSQIDGTALAVAGAAFALLCFLNWLSVRAPLAYLAVGFLMWAAMLGSGIHATVAGVLLAITIPAKSHMFPSEFSGRVRRALDRFDRSAEGSERVLMNEDRQSAVRSIERDCERVQMPLERIEDGLAPWVRYGVMPVFAFANAGVAITGNAAGGLGSGIGLGVILGLVLGKPLGIFAFSYLAVRFGLASLPSRVRWRHIAGIGVLAGIGFTMSLFIAGLAFGEGDQLQTAKLAILLASALAGVLGYFALRGKRLAVGRE